MIEIIPEELRQAHEDGEVVFFCGAGVSIPAGLDSFVGLVRKILEELAPTENKAPLPWKAFKDHKYDEVLDILERHEQGGFQEEIRDRVKSILEIRARTLKPHKTLVRLADLDKPEGRLITTNFDPLFEKAMASLRRIEKSKFKLPVDIAPTLPPPKALGWHSLVYLHGKLGHSTGNRNLILTTSDFGAAYLLDRWASRFVTELFRTFHVVFVGYRIEDPTMRYLVSALAAARDNKEHYKEAFVFTSFGDKNDNYKNQNEAIDAWKIKGVTAIPYDNSSGEHQKLWQALEKWSGDHRGGLLSRRRIAAQYGKYPPTGKDDVHLSELVWALKDTNVSRYIAELEGEERLAPEWVALLQGEGLLSLPVGKNADGQSINVPLVSRVLPDHQNLHDATFHLGNWIARCLDSKDVLNWVLSQGGVLHRNFRWAIQSQLKNGNNTENIHAGLMIIWKILANNSYAHALSSKNSNGFPVYPHLSPENYLAQRDFITCLKPIPVFSIKPDYFSEHGEYDPKNPSSFCDIKIILVGIEGHHDLDFFKESTTEWDEALAVIAEEITTLLSEAMDWQTIFNQAAVDHDNTYIELRSISPHEQNQHAETWTLLIGLARDSFDALLAQDVHAAERLAHRWSSLDYPVFRRLALYAATGK